MLQTIPVGTKALADYASLAQRGLADEIRELAKPLEGSRVLHLSSTAFGGGVAEILYGLVPLMRDVGLEAEWQVIHGEFDFFEVTKTIHNALQGSEIGLTSAARATFERYNRENADAVDGDFDFVVVHDSQPAGVVEHARERGTHWIWRCHIDLSTPNMSVVEFLAPWLRLYDAAIYHRAEYIPDADGLPLPYVWPPAIDPLSPKNMALSIEDAAYILDGVGVDVSRPLLTQISRFDPWKDPIGVIDAYRIVRDEFAEVQLALVGSMAHDDPEGLEFYNRTVAYAEGDPNIYILSNLNNIGSVEVNAFQVGSAAIIQKSTREGFGLTVTEALWKSRPTVAGRVGGIVDQIDDRQSGYLVDSPEECADACLEILRDPDAAREKALRGKEHVRRNFLLPRLLRDWLALFGALSGRTAPARPAGVQDPA